MTAYVKAQWDKRERTGEQEDMRTDAVFSLLLVLFLAVAGNLIDLHSPNVNAGPVWIIGWSIIWGVAALTVSRVVMEPLKRPGASILIRTWIVLLAWGWLLQLRVAPKAALGLAELVTLVVAILMLTGGVWIGSRLGQMPSKWVGTVGFWSLIGAIGLLILTQVRAGDENGASLSIDLGRLGTWQPGEMARILLVVAFAAALYGPRWTHLEALADRLPRFLAAPLRWSSSNRRVAVIRLPVRSLFSIAFVLGGAVGLYFVLNDLSPFLLLALTLVVTTITVVSSARLRVVALVLVLLVLFVGVGAALGPALGKEHVRERYDQMVDPCNPDDVSQLCRAFLANERGLPLGEGLGQGTPRSVEAAQTDFILSVLAEEWGLIGIVGVMSLLLYLLVCCWRHARWAPAGFPQTLATALTVLLACQLLFVLAGVGGLFLHGGLTVPFLSLGGSSATALSLLVGTVIGLGQPGDEEHQATAIARRTQHAQVWFGVLLVAAAVAGFVIQPIMRSTPELQDQQLARAARADPIKAAIVSADGEEIAYTAGAGTGRSCEVWKEDGSKGPYRCYPDGRLFADVTGYFDASYGGGTTALEGLLADIDRCAEPSALAKAAAGPTCKDLRSVPVTLNHRLQTAAAGAFERGAVAKELGVDPADLADPLVGTVIVSDPTNGDVEVLLSTPRYDPNMRVRQERELADGSTLTLAQAGEAVSAPGGTKISQLIEPTAMWFGTGLELPLAKMEQVSDIRGRELRASIARTQTFPIGSVMKLLTSVAAIEHQGTSLRTMPARREYNGRVNLDGEKCGGSIEEMLARSCNSGFSEAADIIGKEELTRVVQRFGLYDTVASGDEPVGPWFDGLDTAGGFTPFQGDSFTDENNEERTKSLTEEAIGLDDTRLSPIEVVTIVNAIANDGILQPLRIVSDCSVRREADLPASPVELDQSCHPEGITVRGNSMFNPTDACVDSSCQLEHFQAVDGDVAGIIRSGMRSAVSGRLENDDPVRGTARTLNDLEVDPKVKDFEIGAKTGTASEGLVARFNDGWCVGYMKWTNGDGDPQLRTFVTMLRGQPGRGIDGSEACSVVQPLLEEVVQP